TTRKGLSSSPPISSATLNGCWTRRSSSRMARSFSTTAWTIFEKPRARVSTPCSGRCSGPRLWKEGASDVWKTFEIRLPLHVEAVRLYLASGPGAGPGEPVHPDSCGERSIQRYHCRGCRSGLRSHPDRHV